MQLDIDTAAKHYGSDAALARALGVTAMCVYQWRRRGSIPVARQFQIRYLMQSSDPANPDQTAPPERRAA